MDCIIVVHDERAIQHVRNTFLKLSAEKVEPTCFQKFLIKLGF